MSARISWDDVWFTTAEKAGERSRCARGQIGCVLVGADNNVVAVSYVGPPADFAPAQEDETSDCRSWCPRGTKTDPIDLDPEHRDCISCHAEQNAIARADFSLLQGGTAYVNATCCINCAKLLAAARVARVVMTVRTADAHRDPGRTIEFLEHSGIEVVKYGDENAPSPD